jgi:hypothetical protein
VSDSSRAASISGQSSPQSSGWRKVTPSFIPTMLMYFLNASRQSIPDVVLRLMSFSSARLSFDAGSDAGALEVAAEVPPAGERVVFRSGDQPLLVTHHSVPPTGLEPACSSYPFFCLEGRGDTGAWNSNCIFSTSSKDTIISTVTPSTVTASVIMPFP